jgi:hypothetical protein
VAKEEVMDWPVPITGKLVPGDAVPPVCVEPTIRKVGEFCEKIEDTLPDDIPTLSNQLGSFPW